MSKSQALVEPLTPIPIGDARLWNESMLVWWYDEAAGISGWQRIGQMPNNDVAEIHSHVLTHEGTRFRRSASVSYAQNAHRTDDSWRVEGLQFRFDDGAKLMSYQNDDCSAELRFEDVHEPVHAAKVVAISAAISAETAGLSRGDESEATIFESDLLYAGHVEAGCRVTGEVTVGGQRYAVNGLGFRDHSWGGIRDLSTTRSCRWVVGTNGTDLSFCLSFAATQKGVAMRHGWIHRDGELLVAKNFDVSVSIDMDGLSWTSGKGWAELGDGQIIEFETEPTWDGSIIEQGPWMATVSPTMGTFDGRRVVIDIQTANNPHGGEERALSALRAYVGQGLSRRPGS
ncbi:hypothetical protein [Mycobacterium sp. E1747]|uniref:DUF7065 domain-containing protein n=1 Tax=Mycobacterium sp. E1747 TaxID=1834128 RepID=UPI000B02C469|nr:hypothetical protein [Mycobacterium sp. E1747]